MAAKKRRKTGLDAAARELRELDREEAKLEKTLKRIADKRQKAENKANREAEKLISGLDRTLGRISKRKGKKVTRKKTSRKKTSRKKAA